MSPDEQAIGLITRLVAQPAVNLESLEITRHTGEISELKEQLEQKDAEIAELRKNVKQREENKNNLLIKLEAKDEEVKILKKRIQLLEDEKKILKEELAAVQFKLKSIEEEMKNLRQSRQDDEEKSSKVDEEMKMIHYTLKEIKKDLAATKSENEVLKKQIRHQSRYVPGALPLMFLQVSKEANASKNLGEMCLQIQAGFYKKILPGYFTPIRSYKVATLKKDIEKLSKTVNEKAEARKRWEESAESLERQLERVNGLIDIWKNLVDCGEKA